MALGCARHQAAIYDRGGRLRIADIDPLTSVDWARQRDDMSQATITVQNPTVRCIDMLQRMEVNRSELVIFRDNKRVWEGPISLITDGTSTLTIEARDVMYYAYRAITRAGLSNAYPNIASVVTRAKTLLTTDLASREALSPPINVVPHIRAFHATTDAQTSKETLPYQTTTYQDIDEMAARSGLDYTVVGRSVLLWDHNAIIGQTPPVTEQDFIGEIIVSRYGMEHATRAAVTDGRGTWAATADVVDPYYGIWEILDTAYDENTSTTPTTAQLLSQAERNLRGRNPVAPVVRVPDGSRLNPNGVLTMDHLVPGVHIPLVATLTLQRYSQMQKLDRVRVTEDATGEKIMVTMSPAAAEDVAEED